MQPLDRPRNPERWSFSDLALARPVMIGMLLAAVLILGVLATFKLPLAFMPTRTGTNIGIRFRLARTSPELLERDIIRPIEEQVAGLRGLQEIRVGSGPWGVRVDLRFVPGTDIDARKQEVRERLDRLRPDLPETMSRIEIESATDADRPVMALRIASAHDLSGQYAVIDRHIVRPLERISGVARIEFEGVGQSEFEVALDLEAASRAGVAIEDIGSTLRSARQGRSLGLLRAADTVPGVRSPARDSSPESYASLPLRRARSSVSSSSSSTGAVATGLSGMNGADRMNGAGDLRSLDRELRNPALLAARGQASEAAAVGQTARLGDVAEVAIHPEEVRAFRRLDGLSGINMDIYAQAGHSPVDISRAVREALEEIRQDPALGGVETMIFFDQGETILATLGDLKNTGVYGGLLGVIVLFLFLRRLQTTLVAALCIPLTILATCGILFLRGEELNCIVLLGLVLGVGMLIDNAVVIVEAIELHARRGEPIEQAIARGSREVGLATIASTISSVIVFLPLMFGDPADEASAYLQPLGVTFATVLICSLIVSQTSVPLLMRRVLPRSAPARPRPTPLLDAVAAAYGWLIRRSLSWPKLTILIALALAGSAVFPATQLNLQLGEVEEQPEDLPIAFEFVGSPGYKKIGEYLTVMEDALLARKDELGLLHVSCSYSDWWGHCSVHPTERPGSEADVERYRERIQAALPVQPGVRYRVGEERHRARRHGDRKEVLIAIKGEDMGVLMDLAQRATEHLRATLPRGDADDPDAGGFDTIQGPLDEGSHEIHIALDESKLQRVGLRSDQVARFVSTAFQGLPLGQVRGPDGEIALRLSSGMSGRDRGLDEDERLPGVAELRDLRIRLDTGEEIPLSHLATFETARSPFFVQRLDRETQVQVKVRFFNADPQENKELVNAAMESFTFPPGYGSGDWIPWWRDREAKDAMMINLALCLLLVYAVMASLFESFLQPFAILATCLLGCIGAPWAMWATGTTVDTTAMIGLFILIGIVVNNGIMLIDRVTQLRARGLNRADALEQAGRDRIRPILMTALTTILGLVPMLIHHPTLAGVYYHAIAIIISGGLLTSTLMTLVFLPATYSVIEDVARASLTRFRRIVG
ncbi:MAG: efflux RND transporter permease subunit [Nannocystaceae bacterium]